MNVQCLWRTSNTSARFHRLPVPPLALGNHYVVTQAFSCEYELCIRWESALTRTIVGGPIVSCDADEQEDLHAKQTQARLNQVVSHLDQCRKLQHVRLLLTVDYTADHGWPCNMILAETEQA